MAKDEKQVIESYKLTAIRSSMGIYAQRILLRIVEGVQNEMNGLSFKNGRDIRKINVKTETNLWGEKEFIIPLRLIMGASKNVTSQLKDQIKELFKVGFEYEDDKVWKYSAMFTTAEIMKGTECLRIGVRAQVWEALMDFSKGFRKFSIEQAVSFKSTYSLRFYKLISLQKKPLQISIKELRKMFGLEKVYPDTRDFIRKTIEVAKKELDACSPYTFDFERGYADKQKIGRKAVTSIIFIPKYQAQFDSEAAQEEQLIKLYPEETAVLSRKAETWLMKNFKFTKAELDRNRKVFEAAIKNLKSDFVPLVNRIWKSAQEVKPQKPQGYLVGSLKTALKERGFSV